MTTRNSGLDGHVVVWALSYAASQTEENRSMGSLQPKRPYLLLAVVIEGATTDALLLFGDRLGWCDGRRIKAVHG